MKNKHFKQVQIHCYIKEPRRNNVMNKIIIIFVLHFLNVLTLRCSLFFCQISSWMLLNKVLIKMCT